MSVRSIRNRSGFTLFELLITIMILGMIMTGLYQALATSLASYEETKEKQALLDTARFTMDRMVRFAQETDWIGTTGFFDDWLEVSERVLDTYDNSTHAYLIDGDGLLDADNDSDGFVNEDGTDPTETSAFTVDYGDLSNLKIVESRPDYSTASTGADLRARDLVRRPTAGERPGSDRADRGPGRQRGEPEHTGEGKVCGLRVKGKRAKEKGERPRRPSGLGHGHAHGHETPARKAKRSCRGNPSAQ